MQLVVSFNMKYFSLNQFFLREAEHTNMNTSSVIGRLVRWAFHHGGLRSSAGHSFQQSPLSVETQASTFLGFHREVNLFWVGCLSCKRIPKQAGLTRQNPQNIKMADEEVDIDLADPEVFLCKFSIKTISSAQICTEKYFYWHQHHSELIKVLLSKILFISHTSHHLMSKNRSIII